jgi:hypothetical protein
MSIFHRDGIFNFVKSILQYNKKKFLCGENFIESLISIIAEFIASQFYRELVGRGCRELN